MTTIIYKPCTCRVYSLILFFSFVIKFIIIVKRTSYMVEYSIKSSHTLCPFPTLEASCCSVSFQTKT